MTARTHERFSIGIIYILLMLVSKYGLTSVNYYACAIVMLAIGIKGAKFPDVDHSWQNVKEKTTPNWIINKVIHATGGKHRSRHTHSWDICLVSGTLIVCMIKAALLAEVVTEVNYQIFLVIVMGFYGGWISHLISDMLTSEGVYLMWFNKKKIKLVPKHIGKFRFNTGNDWEAFVYRTARKSNFILGAFAMIYPLLDNPNIQDIIVNILRV